MFERADGGRLTLKASRDDLDVTGFVLPLDGSPGCVVVTLSDRSARMFDVRSNRLEEIAHYSGSPWFADSVRLGRRLVRTAADRRSLTVAVLGERRLVVPVEEPAADAATMLHSEQCADGLRASSGTR